MGRILTRRVPRRGFQFRDGSAALVVKKIPNCDLWLRGDNATLLAGAVTQMTDLSGLGHHCTPSGVPTVTQVVPADGNGMQAFRFTGAELYASANVDWTGATECTVFMVYKRTNATGTLDEPFAKGVVGTSSGFLFQLRIDDSISFGGQQGANYNVDATGANSYPPNGIPYLASGSIDAAQVIGAENSLWVQGFAETISDVGGSVNLTDIGANDSYYVGARGSGAAYFSGDIYEVIVFKRKLTTAERRAVELYLANRYNILTDQRPMTAPTQYPNLALWLDASLGVTTVDATIQDPSDMSAGSWINVSLSNRTATTITEDGSNGLHAVAAIPGSTGLQTNHPYHVHALVPASSGVGRYVTIIGGNGGEEVYLDTQAGAILATHGNVTNATYVAGVLDFDAVSAAGPNIYVATGNGTFGVAAWSYQGNSTRTATVLLVQVTQRNVSVWADQSGLGHDLTQATAGLRPLFEPSEAAFGGRPALRGDGSDDQLASAAAFCIGAASQFIAMYTDAVSSDAGVGGGAVAQVTHTHHTGGTLFTYAGGGFASFGLGIHTPVVIGARWTGDTTANGLKTYLNGTFQSQATAAGAGVAEVFKAFRSIDTAWAGRMSVLIRYFRLLSVAENRVVTRYVGNTCSIAVA